MQPAWGPRGAFIAVKSKQRKLVSSGVYGRNSSSRSLNHNPIPGLNRLFSAGYTRLGILICNAERQPLQTFSGDWSRCPVQELIVNLAAEPLFYIHAKGPESK